MNTYLFSAFQDAFAVLHKQFQNRKQQQDACEFLDKFIDCVSEYFSQQNNSINKNYSICQEVQDKCLNCGKVSKKESTPDYVLRLPFETTQSINLEDLIIHALKSGKEKKCANCEARYSLHEENSIFLSIPNVIIIQLKRFLTIRGFASDRWQAEKNKASVTIPENLIFNISDDP